MSLAEHARRELELLGEEPEVTEQYLKVIQAFDDMGHSGGSMMAAIPVIHTLLCQKNLTALTDYPDDWTYHDESVWGAEGGIWQSKRNSAAFSADGGKSYYFLRGNSRSQVIMTVKDERPVPPREKT